MGYHVVRPGEHDFDEHSYPEGATPRRTLNIAKLGELSQSRARLWKLPPKTRGSRHIEHGQEEVFVVLSGTMTMLLGEPPERVDLPPESVVTIGTGTPLQLRNESDEELVLFAYGAPAADGQAEKLDDIQL